MTDRAPPMTRMAKAMRAVKPNAAARRLAEIACEALGRGDALAHTVIAQAIVDACGNPRLGYEAPGGTTYKDWPDKNYPVLILRAPKGKKK